MEVIIMSELNAAAYCRVSINHDEQESTFEAQISYYEKLISDHDGWKLLKIYADKLRERRSRNAPSL